MDFVATTKLTAVAMILESINETAPANLENASNPDVVDALNTLIRVSKRIQSKGWHFNTQPDLILSPDGSGFITLPANTLEVDTTGADKCTDVIARDGKLYNLKTRTFVFTEDMTVNLIEMLDFDELPEQAKDYIALEAGVQFQATKQGEELKHRFETTEAEKARRTLERHYGRIKDANILSGNFSVNRIQSGRRTSWSRRLIR